MPDDDLQALVDGLADVLHRSVAIDDPALRLLAASRHFGDEDELRVGSVLNRMVDPEISRGVLAQGIGSWTRPGTVHVPSGRDRFCVPVRCNSLLLGYLWLIEDPRAPLSDGHVDAACTAADRAGVALYRRLLLRERTRARHESMLRELVSSDPAVRAQTIDDLAAEQLFPEGVASYRIVAVQRAQAAEPLPAEDVALAAAVEEGQRALPEGATLAVAHRTRAWLLVAGREPLSDERLDALAKRTLDRFHRLTAGRSRLVVGVGDAVGDLEEVVGSHRNAFTACRAALLAPRLGDVARWGHLGIVGLLLSMPVQELRHSVALPGLDLLRETGGNRLLLRTLRVFLDNAGDIRRSADELCVHRATLYNRLRKVEQLTGRRLDEGEDRLLLHLALHLDDLADAMRTSPLPDAGSRPA